MNKTKAVAVIIQAVLPESSTGVSSSALAGGVTSASFSPACEVFGSAGMALSLFWAKLSELRPRKRVMAKNVFRQGIVFMVLGLWLLK